MKANEVTEQIIASAIEVHRALGPGLLESAYEACLVYELSQRGLYFQRQSSTNMSASTAATDRASSSIAKSSSSSKRLIGSLQSTKPSCCPTSNCLAAKLAS